MGTTVAPVKDRTGGGLEVIEPAAMSVQFGDRRRKIRPLRIGQLPAFAESIGPLGGSVSASILSDHLSLEVILALLAEGGDSFITAVSIASGITEAELGDGDAADLLEVAAAVFATNRDFLSPSPAEGRAIDASGGWDWADTIQCLISGGHQLAEIRGYTIAQCRAFMGAIERRNAEQRLGDAICARMAQSDDKAFKAYRKALAGPARGR